MSSIIFSDLHNEAVRVEEKTDVLTQIREQCKKLKVKRVFFLGDMFDTRGRIPTVVQNAMAKEFRKWKKEKIDLYAMPGNHDYADKEGLVHSLELFKEFDNIKILDESSLIEINGTSYGFIPYQEDLGKELIDSDWYDEDIDYLFIHNGIEGATYNENTLDTESRVKSSIFKFVRKHVFAGHYHHRQTIGNVTFVGSCIQQKIDERGQDKGFILLDENTGIWEHVNLDTPRFVDYTVNTDEIKKLKKGDFKDHREKDYVRIFAEGTFNSYKRLDIEALRDTCKTIKVDWKPIRGTRATRIEIKSTDSRVKTLEKYVNYMTKDKTKRAKLIKLGRKLYNERNSKCS